MQALLPEMQFCFSMVVLPILCVGQPIPCCLHSHSYSNFQGFLVPPE